jgi:uncharacterized protein YrrD
MMSNRTASQTLEGNPVISISNGQEIGKIDDILIDTGALRAAAVVTSGGNLLNREMEAIPAAEVEVWGLDACLVKQPDAILKGDELDRGSQWLSMSDDLRGHEVVAEDGTRVGTLSDVVLDDRGQVMGYEMDEVTIEGRVAVANWIDVKATLSLGPDVLIVKKDYV